MIFADNSGTLTSLTVTLYATEVNFFKRASNFVSSVPSFQIIAAGFAVKINTSPTVSLFLTITLLTQALGYTVSTKALTRISSTK